MAVAENLGGPDDPVPLARSTRELITDAATVNGYKLGSLAARALPGPFAGAAAQMMGLTFSAGMRDKREMVERHLQRVDPSLRGLALRQAVQRAFDSYARYYVESFRLPNLSSRAVNAGFTVEGYDKIPAALELGKGVILALPHLGGWEWAGRWLIERGYKMTVVVEPIEPPELFEWFAELRQKLGMTVVPLGPTVANTVLKALRENQVVCLLCDRDLDHNGIPVQFFGEQTTLPAGPATLGLRTGAAVFPVGVYFTDRYNGHHAVVRPALPAERRGGLREDVARLTQILAGELEYLIRRAPEQWHLFQPNWPSDPGYSS
ncbi:MAG: putative acyltransferase [Ilumatobacteraceae bacterium]|nr:putative acyltransferase [Ilumatobacteraceae bacterium]